MSIKSKSPLREKTKRASTTLISKSWKEEMYFLFLTLPPSCPQIEKFREQLRDAAQKVHAMKPVPGKANGVLVLNQDIPIEAYVGLMSFLGNGNKLGYCMARGNIGF